MTIPFIDRNNALSHAELDILKEADECQYAIADCSCLGDIHNNIPVYILDKRKPIIKTYTITQEAINNIIEHFKQELSEAKANENKEQIEKIESNLRKINDLKPGERQIPIVTLGEYIPERGKERIHLYIETIRTTALRNNSSAEWLLAQVYAHEMHHAVYDTDHSIGNNTNTFVEEPMAELGMLCWIETFEQQNVQYKGILNEAIRSVDRKKNSLPHYGFGAYTYIHTLIKPQMLVKAIKSLLNNTLIDIYSTPFLLNLYPWNEEKEYSKLLNDILLNIYDKGTCGNNIKGFIDRRGTLRIIGSGKMDSYIEGHAPWYAYREEIENVFLSEGLLNIGDCAFLGYYNLKSVMIPDSIIQIGECAFGWCRSLTSIKIPDSVTKIGERAFEGCRSLTSIKIPNNVKSIESRTFAGCESLRVIRIPDSVTKIGESTFGWCSDLKSIIIPNSVTIDRTTFEGCYRLRSMEIPNEVTHIKYYYPNMFNINHWYGIPDGIMITSDSVLWVCAAIDYIISDAIVPPILSAEVLENLNKNIHIYVPKESVDAYKNADGWKEFPNLQAQGAHLL